MAETRVTIDDPPSVPKRRGATGEEEDGYDYADAQSRKVRERERERDKERESNTF